MKTGTETSAAPGPRVLRHIEEGMVVLAVIAILLICAIIFSGVVTRAMFNWSLPDAEIFVRDLMIAAIILPLAYVTATRSHIAVDVFVNLMPAAARPWSDLLGSVIGLLVLLPVAYGGWLGFWAAWGDGNYYDGEFDVPEWPGKLVFGLGYAVFLVRLAFLVLADLGHVLRPRPQNDLEG